MTGLRMWAAGVGFFSLAVSSASAQGVAFFPQVASFPNGVSMSATPVVSFDRRYVRLGMNPQFTVLEGFDPFQVPAAVSGGGVGPGGIGGGLVGFAGLNGPMAGPGNGLSGIGIGGQRAHSGFAGDQGDAFSSDFEDQPWPSTSQVPAPRSRSGAPLSKAAKRRRTLASRTSRPSAVAPKASTEAKPAKKQASPRASGRPASTSTPKATATK